MARVVRCIGASGVTGIGSTPCFGRQSEPLGPAGSKRSAGRNRNAEVKAISPGLRLLRTRAHHRRNQPAAHVSAIKPNHGVPLIVSAAMLPASSESLDGSLARAGADATVWLSTCRGDVCRHQMRPRAAAASVVVSSAISGRLRRRRGSGKVPTAATGRGSRRASAAACSAEVAGHYTGYEAAFHFQGGSLSLAVVSSGQRLWHYAVSLGDRSLAQ